MYAIYGNMYHQYTPNVSIYTIHGSYGLYNSNFLRYTTSRLYKIQTALRLQDFACFAGQDQGLAGMFFEDQASFHLLHG